MDIYFDNSATTKIDLTVLAKMNELNDSLYANPSAMHRLGFLVEEEVKKATEGIAKNINAEAKEIIWTSGGSESNNLAIKGYVDAYKRKGNRLITTTIEHPSVYRCFKKLEEDGFDVRYLKVDSTGHIDIEELKSLIDDNTILVSIMYVNNEIGSVQDIDNIGKTIKTINNNCAFHVDFVQGYGKYRVDVKKSKIDFLSISSHKFYGPKGVGVLYKNKDVRINPIILGGSQQNGYRAGTLNTTGIIGTYVASDLVYTNLNDEFTRLKNLKKFLIDELLSLDKKYGIITINSNMDDTFAPHIVSISFRGIRAEVMLHALEEKGVYVSSGSACSSHDKKTSSILLSIGLKPEIAESTIRISFGRYNNENEIISFISILDELIPKLNIKK